VGAYWLLTTDEFSVVPKMPLYEYECSACGHHFERIQRFSDPLVDVCPSCGKGPVNKLLSAPAVHFKGSGWYVTDYAKKGASSAGRPEGSSAEKKAEKESGKTSEAASSSAGSEASKPADANQKPGSRSQDA
jgi:putative FmdB family regulatory protein